MLHHWFAASVGREQKRSGVKQNSADTKRLRMANLGTEIGPLSSTEKGQETNGRYRIRTCDRLIKSQLLCQLS